MPLKLILLFSFFFLSPHSFAGVEKVIRSSPQPHKPGRSPMRCQSVFSNAVRHESTWTESITDGSMALSKFVGFGKERPFHIAIPQLILNRWSSQRGYTPEQIKKLESIDANFDKARTSYLAFLHEGESGPVHSNATSVPLSGARIFDGSTKPLFNGSPFPGISPKTRDLSFEADLKAKGFTLPERALEELTGKPAYIWEVGLLNVERDYKMGVHSLLGVLAREILDPHYNNNHFNLFGKMEELSRKNLTLYSIARKTNLRINKALGFELVYDIRTKEPVQTSEGLYLLKMSGTKLMETYADFALKPIKRGEDHKGADTELKKARTDVQQYFEFLQKDVPKIKDDNDYMFATYRVSRLHDILFRTDINELIHNPAVRFLKEEGGDVKGNVKMNLYLFFFEAYYQLAYARFKAEPGMTPEKFSKLIQPYEIMVHDFPRFEENYKLFREGLEAGELMPLWSMEQVREFITTNGSKLKVYSETNNFLETWMPENEFDPSSL